MRELNETLLRSILITLVAIETEKKEIACMKKFIFEISKQHPLMSLKEIKNHFFYLRETGKIDYELDESWTTQFVWLQKQQLDLYTTGNNMIYQ